MHSDVVLGIATVLLAVLGGVISVHPPNKSWYKLSCVVAFTILGVVSMIFVIRQSNENATVSRGLSDALQNLQQSAKDISGMTLRNTELQSKLLRQSLTIADLSKQGISVATGGDSFCYVIFTKPRDVSGFMMAVSHGNYPLHDVEIRVVDLEAFTAANHLGDIANPYAGSVGNRIDTFPPKTAQPIGSFLLGMAKKKSFNIFFLAVNGSWEEELRLQKINGVWLEAIRVKKLGGPELRLIYTEIEPGFPLKGGKVDWGN